MNKWGRIVRIFDDEKVAVNLGSQDGVDWGAKCFIYAEPVEIEDPESNESLGSYRHLKARARVTSVAENFCIVGPLPRQEQVTESPGSIRWFAQRQRTETTPGEFPINEFQAEPIPSGNQIAVGDTAIVLVPDDSSDEGATDQ